MKRAKIVRGVSPVPEGLSEPLTDFLGQVRRVMQDVQQGRVAVLQPSGNGSGGSGGAIGGGGGGGGAVYEPDLTPPPTPSGVNVQAGMDFVGVTTDAPVFTAGHGYLATVIYGAKYGGTGPLPTFDAAGQVGDFIGEVGTFPTEAATQWHIWVKWKTRDGVLSLAPAGGATGFMVTTGQDVSRLLEALQGMLRNEQLDPTSNFRFKADLFTIESTGGSPAINPFTVLTVPTMTPAGELLPAGVYMEATYIKNLEVALGRFQTAVITNAMIQNLSATKVTSGVMLVGNYIQSSDFVAGEVGWRLVSGGVCQLPAAFIIGKLTASQIDGKGLSIYRPDGSILLNANGAGNALPWTEVGGRPSDDSIRNNLIDLSWWKRLGAYPWSTNQEENTLYASADLGGTPGPKGGSDVMWYAREATGNGENGGGWDGALTTGVDPSKVYRFVVPIRNYSGNDGNAYWGPIWNQVCDLNTTNPNSNPYFANINRGFLKGDRWYLFVGFVFPYGSSGNTHNGAGIYDCKTGELIAGGVNYNHAPGGANGHRAYQYYAALGSVQLFGRPMINLVDGTEPPLREYFESASVLNSVVPTNAGNQFPNSDFRNGWDQLWQIRWNQNGGPIAEFNRTIEVWPDGSWMPKGVYGVTLNTVNQSGYIDLGIVEDFPAKPGDRYEFSMSFFSHRCGYGLGLLFVDAAGTALGGWVEKFTSTIRDNNAGMPAVTLADRMTIFAVAPAGTARAQVYIRKGPQLVPSDSWIWAFWPYFGVAAPAQVEPSSYSPGPLRTVRSLGYGGDLNATYGATIGSNLFGFYDQASYDIVMNGSALIRLAHINTATIGNLAALAAYLGNVQIAAGGALRSGKSSFSDPSQGFYLGNEGGVQKFRITSANGTELSFDGNDISMRVYNSSVTFLGVKKDVSTSAGQTRTGGATATATVTYSRNGNNWYDNSPSSTIGDGYWIRVSLQSGATPNSGTMNTWVQLNADRTWTLSATNTVREFVGDVAISTSSSGTPIVATGTMRLQAQSYAGGIP